VKGSESGKWQFWALIATLLLLGAIATERLRWPDHEDVAPYHTAVRREVQAFPTQVGDWQGQQQSIPQGARSLLRPNVTFSRIYRNTENARAFTMLFIQCRDARDMLGHFPPACYPAQGWSVSDTQHASWRTAGQTIKGTIYHLEKALYDRLSTQTVVNVILLPNGQFAHTMDEVQRVAADRQYRHYGAAQIQFVFGRQWSTRERRRIVQRFLGAAEPAIDVIRRGAQHE
jgi:hypothetical protein